MLSISNIYGHGFGGEELQAVERAGFVIRPKPSRYPGAQLCRFIDFAEGPALELIEVEDDRAYLHFAPLGMKPYAPGISLLSEDRGEDGFADYEVRFAKLRPYRHHFNYDGTETPSKPGWNYLNFGIPVVEETFLWLTQMDHPSPLRPKPEVQPNRVRRVTGLVFDLEARRLERLSEVARSHLSAGSLAIDEVRVWCRDALQEPVPRGAKVFPLVAVVLEADRLDGIPRSVRAGHETTFRSRPAVLLPTNDLSWDLLIVEA